MRLAVRGGGYRYPAAARPAVRGIDLEVGPGERVLVAGRSGSGKSTLIRLAAGLLARHGSGEALGEVRVDGLDPAACPPAARAARVSLVAQDPHDQVLASRVDDELAFGLLCAHWPEPRIADRVPELRSLVGLAELDPARSPATLSGGELQRLLVGAALGPGAGLLLLDEPLSQLDPRGAAALLGVLDRLTREGAAVVMVEHRLEVCLPWASRVVLLEGGALAADLAADRVDAEVLAAVGLGLPSAMELDRRLRGRGRSVDQAPARPERARPPAPASGGPRIEVAGLSVVRGGVEVVRVDALRVGAGERVAVVGPNGAGKSSLLQAIALGVRGVRVFGRCAEVPQDPDLSLFSDTVRDELAYAPRAAGLDDPGVSARVAEAARDHAVGDLLERAPQSLSRGQRLRVAVAATSTCDPAVILLDEPTAGQERAAVDRMMGSLVGALGEVALLFATHDLEVALRWGTRVLLVDRGRIAFDGPPDDFPGHPALPLPPLVALCRRHGLSVASVDALAEAW